MHHHRSSLRRRFDRLPLPGKAAVIMLAAAGVLRAIQAWGWRALDGTEPMALALAARRLAHGSGLSLLGPPPWHMGSAETVLGGMLFMAFSENGFILGIATALFSFAALWALWRWARSATGETGGLLAVLVALFGPPGWFAAQSAPTGGWMAALAFECLLLAQAARMADDIRDRWEPSSTAYAGLGFLAGLGLWTTRLLLPAVLVALWVLGRAMQGRWKKHWLGALAMTAGTIPGLAAWLYGLLQYSRSPLPAAATVPTVLRPDFWQRLAAASDGFFRFGETPVPRAMAALLILLALSGFCWSLAAARRRHAGGHHEHNPPRSAAAALALVYPFWLAFCGGTTSGDGLAWIPWMPSLAILAAVACTVPRKRWLRHASVTALAVTVAWQTVLGVLSLCAHASLSSQLSAEHRSVASALAERGTTALLAPIRAYPLNIRLRETVAVTDGSPACDPVILRKAELAQAPAWDADYPGLRDWLQATGARAESFTAAGHTFLTGLEAPIPPLREWPKAPYREPAAATPIPETALADGRLDTWLESRGGGLSLVWRFPAPVTPAALRFLFDDRGDPTHFATAGTVRVEFLRDGIWSRPVDIPLPILETSLGRPYPRSPLSFRILPLPSPLQPADGLRATILTAPGTAPGLLPWRLAEAALFTAPPPDATNATADRLSSLIGDAILGDLRAHLSRLPPDITVFAPRRLSGRLAVTGALPPQRLGIFADSASESPTTPVPALVPDDRTVCLCVETRLADTARLALGAADRPAETDVCGPWTLFVLTPPDLEKHLPGTRLRWAGDLPVADIDFHEVDRLTDIILGKLQGQKTKSNEWLKSQYEADPAGNAAGGPITGPSGLAAPTLRWREEPGQALPDTAPADAALPASTALDPAEEAKTLRFIRQLSLVRPESLAVLPEEIVFQAGGTDLLDLRTRTGIRPIRPLETVFRDGLILQGIDASPSVPITGATIALTLFWQASGNPLLSTETTRLEICTPDGQPVATTEWTGPANLPGYADFALPLRECQTETVILPLPPDLPSGPLQIRIGRLREGRPVPVKSSRGVVASDAATATLTGVLGTTIP